MRVIAPAVWIVAFTAWVAHGQISFQRYTLIFWAITGLVAFTIGRRPWWQAPLDWAPLIVFFLAYDYTRGLASTLGFPTHWELPARIDRVMFGEVPSVWLQEHWAAPYDAVPWWETLWAVVYLSFFVVPVVLACVLWVRSRTQFVRFMSRLMLVAAIALVGYVVVPAAPPWAAARCAHAEVADHPADPACMADIHPSAPRHTVLRRIEPENEFSPIVRRISRRGFHEIPGLERTRGFIRTGIDASNQVAAVPSLHAAVSLLVAAFAWPLVRRRWRPLLVLYPLAMGFTLVWGGDHYVFDLVLGWGVVAVVMTAASRLEREPARHRKPARQEQLEPVRSLA
jgi:hypothetical protein